MSTTMQPKRFRKRPVEIEAMRFPDKYPPGVDPTSDGYARNHQAHAVYRWVETNTLGSFDFTGPDRPVTGVSIDPADGSMIIATLEGDMRVSPGDWVIRGVQGEFYPCKPDIFAATYDEIGGPPSEEGDTPNGSMLLRNTDTGELVTVPITIGAGTPVAGTPVGTPPNWSDLTVSVTAHVEGIPPGNYEAVEPDTDTVEPL